MVALIHMIKFIMLLFEFAKQQTAETARLSVLDEEIFFFFIGQWDGCCA